MNANEQILLIEDNEDDYEAIARSLKKNQIFNPLQWCKNGQDALDYLNKEGIYTTTEHVKNPSLILLDLNMPGMDGRSVLKHIKQNTNLNSIPIIILTTSTDEKDILHCYSMGANTYIQKPVNYEGLIEAIRTMKEYWFGIAILPVHY